MILHYLCHDTIKDHNHFGYLNKVKVPTHKNKRKNLGILLGRAELLLTTPCYFWRTDSYTRPSYNNQQAQALQKADLCVQNSKSKNNHKRVDSIFSPALSFLSFLPSPSSSRLCDPLLLLLAQTSPFLSTSISNIVGLL